MTDAQFFPYALDRRWQPLFTVLKVGSDDGVTIREDGMLVARYGWWTVKTPLDNVHGSTITGPHRWYTAVGLRLSAADSGLTFGTNHERGVCIDFVDPIPRVIGFENHAALWVSGADPEGLHAALG
ncbi:MAG: hypothetical protein HKN41_00230 [Ilumatobacter sp.]|nr:hypothetical protein [Ilumatobacter sp.]